MSEPLVAAASIFIKASPEKTLAHALGFDVPAVVQKRGFLPGVRSVAGTTGAWSKAGEKRELTLTDGSRVEETLVELTPTGYAYRVANFTGPFKLLVKQADASFSVAPRRNGSMLHWTYEFQPSSALVAPIVSFIVDTGWTDWMDAALERLKEAIEGG